ncbi:mitochondrial import inner membrane translocase subunit 9 [Dictyostelium discoideum AX4]|uniref:Mitochondrial import inner membrane translocase subunit Tim9 n=1 Tax=Dictyostelium discoideum TaxID=44689 RepID=TIM9_DICDI|nr:mitochondrial import inner membrane translocase subunit 9 [Dictyostelium discoideum AX4]Q559H1.1 RecName: Full=Mitochondrial import inner membrane translocase subunit Tim9 [Dictyostelium discoideum]EAL71103.1 mitochondrial import inner membrane translocase subunit 9 [Dictyostelium discoideum AX4]|eukprot:XP_644845.1 mitochondrial import inner membrane translocase subunit 9 [Dictyostelium discoideum AX4]
MDRRLSKKEEERIVNELNKLQMIEMVDTSVNLTNKCFQSCITNFRIRKLDDEEQLCVYKCVEKNMFFTSALNNHFMKLSNEGMF